MDMFHRYNPEDTNEAILSWGDTGGTVNALHFNTATISLFERPTTTTTDTQGDLSSSKMIHFVILVKQPCSKQIASTTKTVHKLLINNITPTILFIEPRKVYFSEYGFT